MIGSSGTALRLPFVFRSLQILRVAHACQSIFHLHPQGSSRRRRDSEPGIHDPRRPDQEACRRRLHVHADGAAHAAKDHQHHPRGNGSRRSNRAHDACRAARRALAGVRPLGQVRPRAASLQGPPPARLRDPAHERRSDHRDRQERNHQLAPAAGESLPDPDQVPRRAPSPLRPDARPRIPTPAPSAATAPRNSR